MLDRLLRFALPALLLACPLRAQDAQASPSTPGPPGAPAETESQTPLPVRYYDLRSLLSTPLSSTDDVDLRLALSASYLSGLEPARFGIALETPPEVQLEDIAQFLQEAVDQAWPHAAQTIEVESGSLRVEGDPGVQDSVQAMLAQVERALLASVDIEVYHLHGEPRSFSSTEPPALTPILSRSATDQLIASGTARLEATQRAPLGQRILLGRENPSAAAYSLDTELGEAAIGLDPAVTYLLEGMRLGASVQPRLDGGTFLRVWSRRSASPSIAKSPPISALGGAQLELPSQASSLVWASGCLENGGALVVGQSGTQLGLWLVRVERPDLGPAARGGGALIPLGELGLRPLRKDSPELAAASPSGGIAREKRDLLSRLASNTGPPQDTAALVDNLWDIRDRLGIQGIPQRLGHQLWIHGSPELTRAAEELVRQRSGQLGSCVQVELAYGLLPEQIAQRVLQDPTTETLLDELGGRILLAGQSGSTMLSVNGQEHFYLQDFDTRVAKQASVVSPVVRHLFSGTSLLAYCTRTASGGISSWIELEVQVDGPSRQVPIVAWVPAAAEEASDGRPTGSLGGFDSGQQLELPTTLCAGLQTRVSTASGTWTLLGSSSIPGNDRVLVAALRASFP